MKKLLPLMAALLFAVFSVSAQNTYTDPENGVTYGLNFKGDAATVSGWSPVTVDGVIKGDVTILASVPIKGIDKPVETILAGVFTQQDVIDKLTTLSLPSSITGFGDNCFINCENLNSINLQDLSSLEVIPSSCFANTAISEVALPKSVTTIKASAFKNCKQLESFVFPDNTGVTTLEQGVFTGCVNLTSVIGLENTKIDEISINLFSGTKLTSIALPSMVTKIGRGAFQDCVDLTTVNMNGAVLKNDYKNGKISTVGIGKNAFSGCTSLESIEIPTGSTALIGNDAFANCTNLKEVVLPSTIGDVQYTNSAGTTVLLSGQFSGCSALESINLQDCTNLTVIPGNMFKGCSSLETVAIPQNVTAINESAFSDCAGLLSVDFSKAAKLTSIGKTSFQGCTKLERTLNNNAGDVGENFFVIPPTVRSIGMQAFNNTGISKLMLRGSKREGDETPSADYTIGSQAFAGTTPLSVVGSDYVNPPTLAAKDVFTGNTYNNADLYVPFNAVDAYKAATGWSEFGNNIQVGVEEVGVEAGTEVYTVYNLHGVRVMQTTDASLPGLAKGVYIVNGRKILK